MDSFTFHLSMYILCLFWCLGVCLSVCIQKTSKRLNQSGPNVVWDLTWPQGRFIDSQNFKIETPLDTRFSLSFDNPWNFFIKSANFFCFCFTMYTKRKWCSIKIKDEHEALWKPSLLYKARPSSISIVNIWSHCIIEKQRNISRIFKIWNFFTKIKTFKHKFLNFYHSLTFRPRGHPRSHKKIGPDRLSRFDVYWTQTNKPKIDYNLEI